MDLRPIFFAKLYTKRECEALCLENERLRAEVDKARIDKTCYIPNINSNVMFSKRKYSMPSPWIGRDFRKWMN